MTLLEEFEQIKKDSKKLQEMIDSKLSHKEWFEKYGKANVFDDYKKTHSNCCDWKMLNGLCLSCKENCVSQWEECNRTRYK